jgi:hypothetical protein
VNLYETIKSKIMSLQEKYKGCMSFILNIIKYKDFLWNDHYWDYHYLLVMLRDKLKNDIEGYQKEDILEYPEKVTDSMQLCVMLLNRLIKDDYIENAFYLYNKKYPDDLPFNIVNEKYFRRCSKRAGLQKEQDRDYLFRTMQKHIFGWWS